MLTCKHLHQWDITEPVLKYLNTRSKCFSAIISSLRPNLKIPTDYLLESFGCHHRVSTIWLKKVLPCRFAFPKSFLKDNYYVLAYASCGSGKYNNTFNQSLYMTIIQYMILLHTCNIHLLLDYFTNYFVNQLMLYTNSRKFYAENLLF